MIGQSQFNMIYYDWTHVQKAGSRGQIKALKLLGEKQIIHLALQLHLRTTYTETSFDFEGHLQRMFQLAASECGFDTNGEYFV